MNKLPWAGQFWGSFEGSFGAVWGQTAPKTAFEEAIGAVRESHKGSSIIILNIHNPNNIKEDRVSQNKFMS